MSNVESTTTTCPECNGRLEAGEETFCRDCGLVVAEDFMDRGPEWRSFSGDSENRERTGAPLTRARHDRGLSTEIGYSRDLSSRKRRQLVRMRRQHNRARIASKADRNRIYAFTEIRRLVSSLELSQSIRDQACVLFESAQSADLLSGRSLEGFAAASVYAVCRTTAVSRTVGEIAEVARASEAELKVAYSALNRELGLPTGPIDPAEYIGRFASLLGVPNDVEVRSRELVTEGRDRGLINGRNPSGFAATCLYAAAIEAGHDLTQREAADVAGVTPITLRTAYYELLDE